MLVTSLVFILFYFLIILPPPSACTEFRNHQLPLARIKKIMKSDEDVKVNLLTRIHAMLNDFLPYNLDCLFIPRVSALQQERLAKQARHLVICKLTYYCVFLCFFMEFLLSSSMICYLCVEPAINFASSVILSSTRCISLLSICQ